MLQGKELSYNNILDLDAAMRLCAEFALPAAAIIKHSNPCGAAVAEAGVAEAYRRARETDPVSAFGGIVAVNRQVDAALAREMSETFLECVIAPSYAPEALQTLSAKKNLRLLAYDFSGDAAGALEYRSVAGGLLVQTRDTSTSSAAAAKVVSKRPPTEQELADLDFAWRVCKHVKSNAIVFAADGRTLGVGAGQMSSVVSVRIAVSKARASLKGSVVASTRSSCSATASTSRPRRAPSRSSSRAAWCATRSRRRPPTSTAWRSCSRASGTSGTRAPWGRASSWSDRAGASTRSRGSWPRAGSSS